MTAEPTLSVMTWNVNSIRQRLDQVLILVEERRPDVICLQETKVDDGKFPRVPLAAEGYELAVHGSKGYAGVAIASRRGLARVRAGFQHGPPDRAARLLRAEVEGVEICNVYCPNGTELGSEPFAYKLAWFERLAAELRADGVARRPAVLCGDFNVAPTDLDVYDPVKLAGALHATADERRALAALVELGFVDCFRTRYPDRREFSWYDYRGASLERGHGLRIDHLYASQPLARNLREIEILPEPRRWDSPSDHLPVLGRFSLATEP